MAENLREALSEASSGTEHVPDVQNISFEPPLVNPSLPPIKLDAELGESAVS
jgi:hypothetical protein